ncbi:MAG: phosphoribosylanthranilate isomerase, partial [Vicinamibacteria bacterium]
GVFVDADVQEALAVADAARLDVLQLHGDEPVDTWTSVGRPIVKALTLATYAASPWLDVARAILLDAHDPQRRGGTGVPIDWHAAAAIAHRRPVILAGGLTADNVGEAVARVRPAALDVASGVEQSPGLKSPARLRAFFDAVRQADARVGDAAPADKEHA